MKKIIVTGAGGLIGSEAVSFFAEKGFEVLGIDNNMRKYFFGEGGDTSDNLSYLTKRYSNFTNINIDIRNRDDVMNFIGSIKGEVYGIIHTAAQPSRDWAAKEPFTDFDVNALGTLNMLEAYRLNHPKAVFIFTSTNKVYGDKPNVVNLIEYNKRYDYSTKQDMQGIDPGHGINEQFSIDNSIHSLFGASKVSADILAQEYGKYFNLPIGVFRGGCLTGRQHSSVELHGFLSYIMKCAVNNKPYTIFGYKGKQVRDQIHSSDVVNAFWHFMKNPRNGEVYNIGGGLANSASVLEIIDMIKDRYGLTLNYTYNNKNRVGDHICYYTDMRKFMSDYPGWKIKKTLPDIMDDIMEGVE